MAGGEGGLPHPRGADLSRGGMCRRRRVGAEQWGQGHSQRPRVPGGPSLSPSTSALTWPSEGKGNRQGREELIFSKRWARGPLGVWRPGWGRVGSTWTDPSPEDPWGGWQSVRAFRPQLGLTQDPCPSPQGAHPSTHVARTRRAEPPALMAKAGGSAEPGWPSPGQSLGALAAAFLRWVSCPSCTTQSPDRVQGTGPAGDEGRGGRCWDLAQQASYFQKEGPGRLCH